MARLTTVPGAPSFGFIWITLGAQPLRNKREINMQNEDCKVEAQITDRDCHLILLKNPMNASTRLSMNGKSPMISTAPPFVLRLSKDERRVFQQNQKCFQHPHCKLTLRDERKDRYLERRGIPFLLISDLDLVQVVLDPMDKGAEIDTKMNWRIG